MEVLNQPAPNIIELLAEEILVKYQNDVYIHLIEMSEPSNILSNYINKHG